MIQDSLYHALLRIAMVVGAFVLVFQSGILSQSTAILAQNTERYLANAVGVTVGVAPTELNTITAALTERQQQLDAREALLREREIAVSIDEGGAGQSRTTFILSTMLFILLCLIVINYILDFMRSRERVPQPPSSVSGYA